MSAPITITLDSNERGTDRAKALALAVGGDPAYELPTKRCSHCKKELPLSKFQNRSSWCRRCKADYTADYRLKHPDKIKLYEETHKREHADRARIRSHLTGKKRPVCSAVDSSSFLGVYVAERVLARVFGNVKIMPYGHSGYDFICSKGYKIDVKSSCRRHQPKKSDIWIFGVGKNVDADYFLFLAFNDRAHLDPEHVWLVPGKLVNSKTGIGISDHPKALVNWAKYEQPIEKVVACCNVLREEAHA